MENQKTNTEVVKAEPTPTPEQVLVGRKVSSGVVRELNATRNLLRAKKVSPSSDLGIICFKYSGQVLKEDAIRRYNDE